MPLARKRRQQPEPESSDAESPPRRRRANAADSSSEAAQSDEDNNSDDGDAVVTGTNVLVKKLVRLALACEYSRQPIRRNDITQKVLGEHPSGWRQFRHVFDEAQRVLRDRFGMQMVELPLKDKVTISQRRAAQRVEKAPTTSKSWVVTTTLPPAYRASAILPPARAGSSGSESIHTALYSFIVSVITLAGGSIAEQKLDRYLRRVGADSYTPLDRTDRYLARLCKEGYLVRQRDVDGGEEVIEYFVGPRGKVEVGIDGVGGLVREVYGFGNNGGAENGEPAEEEFEAKLRRTLGIRSTDRQDRDNGDEEDDDAGGHGRASRAPVGRDRRRNDDDDSGSDG